LSRSGSTVKLAASVAAVAVRVGLDISIDIAGTAT
jgi:hypothetical protein